MDIYLFNARISVSDVSTAYNTLVGLCENKVAGNNRQYDLTVVISLNVVAYFGTCSV